MKRLGRKTLHLRKIYTIEAIYSERMNYAFYLLATVMHVHDCIVHVVGMPIIYYAKKYYWYLWFFVRRCSFI